MHIHNFVITISYLSYIQKKKKWDLSVSRIRIISFEKIQKHITSSRTNAMMIHIYTWRWRREVFSPMGGGRMWIIAAPFHPRVPSEMPAARNGLVGWRYGLTRHLAYNPGFSEATTSKPNDPTSLLKQQFTKMFTESLKRLIFRVTELLQDSSGVPNKVLL